MSIDLDQQALDLINVWEAGEYLHPAQKKAALQVAIRDALATVERTIFNEALRRAADKIDPHPDMRDDELTQWGKDRREAANQIRALIKEPGHE